MVERHSQGLFVRLMLDVGWVRIVARRQILTFILRNASNRFCNATACVSALLLRSFILSVDLRLSRHLQCHRAHHMLTNSTTLYPYHILYFPQAVITNEASTQQYIAFLPSTPTHRFGWKLDECNYLETLPSGPIQGSTRPTSTRGRRSSSHTPCLHTHSHSLLHARRATRAYIMPAGLHMVKSEVYWVVEARPHESEQKPRKGRLRARPHAGGQLHRIQHTAVAQQRPRKGVSTRHVHTTRQHKRTHTIQEKQQHQA